MLKPKVTENNDAEGCLVTKSYLLGRHAWKLTCTALVLDSQRYLGLAEKSSNEIFSQPNSLWLR